MHVGGHTEVSIDGQITGLDLKKFLVGIISNCRRDFVPAGYCSFESDGGRYRLDDAVKGELELTPLTPYRRLARPSSSPRGKQRFRSGPASGSTGPRTAFHTARRGCFGHPVWEHGPTGPPTSNA